MSLNVGELYAKIKLDLSNFQTSLTTAQNRMRDMAQIIQTASRQISDSMDSVSQTTDATTRRIIELENEIGQLRTAMAGSSNKVNDMAEEIKKLREEMKKAEQQAGDLGNTAEESMQELSIVIGTVTGSMAAFGGIGVAAADDLDAALKRLQFQQGYTNEQLQSQVDIFKQISTANPSEEYESIANAMSSIITATGTSGEEMENATTKAIQLANYMDYGIAESTLAVSSMMKNMGVTADEAFNLIAQGNQNGADMAGDLLDTINEYSIHFASAGKSAEDMINILVTGAQNGTFNVDNMGDSIKELIIRSVDGSKASRDAMAELNLDYEKTAEAIASGGPAASKAMDEIVNGILAVKDKSKQSELAVALVGTKFEDLKMAALSSLVDVKKVADGTKDAFGAFSNVDTKTFGTAMAEMGRLISLNILVPLGEELKPVLFDMINWFKINMPAIQALIGGTGSVIRMVFGGLWTVAKPIFTMLSQAVVAFNKYLGFLVPSLKAIGTMLTVVAIGIGGYVIAVGAAKIATAAWTAVMSLNPIFLIGVAIAGAIVALGELTDWFGLSGDAAEESGDQAVDAQQAQQEEIEATIKLQEEQIEKEKEREEAIKNSIALAKAGVKSAIEDVRKLAEAGVKEAIDALSTIDKAYLKTLLNQKNAQKKALLEQLEIVKAMVATQKLTLIAGTQFTDAGGGLSYTDKSTQAVRVTDAGGGLSYVDKSSKTISERMAFDTQKIKAIESQLAGVQDIIDSINSSIGEVPSSDIGGGSGSESSKTTKDKKAAKEKESAQKRQFDASMKYIEDLKDFNKITLEQEYRMYVTMQNRLNRKTAEGQDLYKQLEKKKYDIQKEMTTKRLGLIKDALDKEKAEVQKAIEKRNETELKAIEKFYNDKIKLATDSVNALREVYAEEDVTEERKRLIDEIAKYEKSVFVEGQETAERLRKELRDLDREQAIKNAEKEAELKRESLEQQKEDALEIQRAINDKNLSDADANWAKITKKYEAQASNMKKSTSSITTAINSESTKIAKAGANLIQNLIDGFNSKKSQLADVITSIAAAINIKTNLGEFKSGSQLYSNIQRISSSPVQYYDEKMGSRHASVNFNQPILKADAIYLNDKLDIQTLANEMFNATNTKLKSSGSYMTGGTKYV